MTPSGLCSRFERWIHQTEEFTQRVEGPPMVCPASASRMLASQESVATGDSTGRPSAFCASFEEGPEDFGILTLRSDSS